MPLQHFLFGWNPLRNNLFYDYRSLHSATMEEASLDAEVTEFLQNYLQLSGQVSQHISDYLLDEVNN